MRQMRDQLRGGFAIHARRREVWRDRSDSGLADIRARGRNRWTPIVTKPPDAAVLRDLVELILLNLGAQIRTRPGPLQLLNDAVIHVGNVERPVGRVADVYR